MFIHYSIVIIVFISTALIHSFNLDTGNSKWILSGGPGSDSNFGYSLSLFASGSQRSVIVGAPDLQTNGRRQGGVFECNNNGSCIVLRNKLTQPSDELTNPGTGFTLFARDNTLMTCSPLWTQGVNIGNGRTLNLYRGECILSSGDTNSQTQIYQPCSNENGIYNDGYGFCSSGFSVTSSQTSQQPFFFVGAPGAVYYEGTVYGLFGNTRFHSGVWRGKEKSAMLGYSVAWGDFSKSRFGEVAAGAPRDNNMKGGIAIFEIVGNDTNRQFKAPPYYLPTPELQIGAYFGASVCAVDVNNDGWDDLLVGAPRYSSKRDEGRVYIFMNQKAQSSFLLINDPSLRFDGESKVSAFFGTAIVSIGDVNQDQYLDVAISAPGSDYTEDGAVFIYSGSRNGLRSKPSQIIRASDVPQGNRLGFGFSLAGGVDVDGNSYPDLAIGAYRSNRAFLFRSNPVASLKDEVKFNVSLVPVQVSCDGPDGNKYRCVEMEIDLTYTGNGVGNSIEVDITFTLDVDNIFPRVFMQRNNSNALASQMSRRFTLLKTRRNPYFVLLYFQVNIRTDVVTPIPVRLNYALTDQQVCGGNPCPVLDQFSTISTLRVISYLRNCGNDEECNPDLVVENLKINLPGSAQQKEIIYGTSSSEVSISCIVSNRGEPGYQAYMKFNFSSDFNVQSVEANQRPVLFSDPVDVDTLMQQVTFPFANPVDQTKPVSILIKMTLANKQPSIRNYLFAVEALSGGKEVNASDNVASINVGTKIQTCVRASGRTTPSAVIYDLDQKQPADNANVDDLGPEVLYSFEVQNAGRLPLSSLLATATFNLKRNGIQIFYIVSMMVGDIACANDNLNPNRYTIPSITTTTAPNVGDGFNVSIRRTRRDVSSALLDQAIASQRQNLNCEGNDDCQSYTCRINSLLETNRVTIQVKARVLAANAIQVSLRPMDILSNFHVLFNSSNKDINVQSANCKMETSVKITISPSVIQDSSSSTDWWLLFAIIAGLSLLAIIVAVLYKGGFFKRYQPLHNDEEGSEVPAQDVQTKDAASVDDEDDAVKM